MTEPKKSILRNQINIKVTDEQMIVIMKWAMQENKPPAVILRDRLLSLMPREYDE